MSYRQYSYNSVERSNPLPRKSTRTREVFPTNEIPHLWAHQSVKRARNPFGNFFFDGANLSSYHTVIASIATNSKRQKAYLLTRNTYSVTTSRQQHAVRMAIPPDETVFHVPGDPTVDNGREWSEKIGWHDRKGGAAPDHKKLIANYQRSVLDLANEAIRSRTAVKIGRLLDEARAELAELQRFVSFFRLPALSAHARIASRKLPFIPESVDAAKELGKAAKQEAARLAKAERERKAAEHMATAKTWMESHPDYAARWDGSIDNAETLFLEFRAAERRAEELARLTDWMSEHEEPLGKWDGTLEQGKMLKAAWIAEDTRQRNAETIAAWLRGEGSSYGIPYDVPTMLRVKDGEVETSRGAWFPVADAKRGYALVVAVMSTGREWHRNGQRLHLGAYQIDSIEANGTVHAGCHVVTWEAIQRIEGELMMAVPDSTEAVSQ